jgi:hypothetical protein
MIIVIAKLVILLLFGFSIVNLFRFKGRWLEKAGLSFLLGTGMVSVLYFLFVWASNRVVSLEFWIITFLTAILLFNFRSPKSSFEKPTLPRIPIRPNLIAIICWVGIMALFIMTLVYAFYRPVYTPDSIYLFDFRAKVMFISQRLTDINQIGNWNAYPMFTSMIGLIWRFMGIDNPSTYYPIMYFSFTLIFYSVLREKISRNLASLGTLLMYTTPVTLWQSQLDGMTNLPYTIFLCLSLLYGYKIMKAKIPHISDLVISSLFLGLSTWTRGVEPIWVVPLFLTTLVIVVKNKMRWVFIYFAILSLIREIWPAYVHKQYISISRGTQIITDNVLQTQIGAAPFVQSLSYTFNSALTLLPKSLGLVCYLFAAAVLLNLLYRKFSIDQLFFLAAVVGILGVIFFGSLFMVINFSLVIDVYNDSLSRLLSVVVPLLWFYIMTSPAWISIESMFKSSKS